MQIFVRCFVIFSTVCISKALNQRLCGLGVTFFQCAFKIIQEFHARKKVQRWFLFLKILSKKDWIFGFPQTTFMRELVDNVAFLHLI
jgi:hypothetical protein